MTSLFLDLASPGHDRAHLYKLFIGFIGPRPIALVSSLGPDGVANLAPFSFFNMVSASPPVVMFSVGWSRQRGRKDTLRNVEGLGEFVIATVSVEFASKMVACAAEVPYGQSEFEFSGLSPAPARLVRPPLVAEAHVNMECRVRQIVRFGDEPGATHMVLGDVLAVHVNDAVLDEGGLIDPRRLVTVGRLGGQDYIDARAPYRMTIPAYESGWNQKRAGPS